MTKTRSYFELSKLPSFEDRLKYLKLDSSIGTETFGFDRYLNQMFYRSAEWKQVRDYVIMRDNGFDLGIQDFLIKGKIMVHHMNPITVKDITDQRDLVLDPEFLITVSHTTHNAIHFGDIFQVSTGIIERTKNDTCPWRRD